MNTTIVVKNRIPGWLLPTGLILLSVIPFIGGIVSLNQLVSGLVTTENARFFVAPLPFVLQFISAIIYNVLGAFQFSHSFRRRKPKWHRRSGYILVPLALITALTGLWMTLFYPSVNFDGTNVYIMRLIVGIAMTLFIVLSIDALWKRNFRQHGELMIRAYALALGAGTQVFTYLLHFLLFPNIQGEAQRALVMGLGWAINIAVAEWIIQRGPKARQKFTKVITPIRVTGSGL